ncbi:TRAIP [Cordylochernes scorpioides]|uniref:TRAIP n=1 Tax=Cordylochernes scorpioides TaxID=51811 RepID=A0ABY6LIG5_9ARAC|nr:TRAIP [Cordylochernes scorpioides]
MLAVAMLATQLNHLVAENQLEKFTIIQLEKYICNQVQPDKSVPFLVLEMSWGELRGECNGVGDGRKILILMDIKVMALGADVGEKLGNPSSGPEPSGGPAAQSGEWLAGIGLLCADLLCAEPPAPARPMVKQEYGISPREWNLICIQAMIL